MSHIRSLLAGALIAALLAAVPAIAAAHAELESSDPEAGDDLDTAPTEVTLIFSEGLDPEGSFFVVVDAAGEEVGSGEVDLSVADRNVMSGTVMITEAGVYTVQYSIVAEDGHGSGGTISFGFNADEAIPDPTSEEPPDTALPRAAPSPLTLAGWLLLVLAVPAGVVGIRRRALR